MDHTSEFRPVSLVLGCLLPGLGHFTAGEKTRGMLIATGVLGLFGAGIFVGGIEVVDKKEDMIWFAGEALVGPLTFAIDNIHQNRFKVFDPALNQWRSAYPNEGRNPKDGSIVPGGKPPNIKSIGKMNELGTLFCTIAGMLNLIAIIDAGWPAPPARRRVVANAPETR